MLKDQHKHQRNLTERRRGSHTPPRRMTLRLLLLSHLTGSLEVVKAVSAVGDHGLDGEIARSSKRGLSDPMEGQEAMTKSAAASSTGGKRKKGDGVRVRDRRRHLIWSPLLRQAARWSQRSDGRERCDRWLFIADGGDEAEPAISSRGGFGIASRIFWDTTAITGTSSGNSTALWALWALQARNNEDSNNGRRIGWPDSNKEVKSNLSVFQLFQRNQKLIAMTAKI